MDSVPQFKSKWLYEGAQKTEAGADGGQGSLSDSTGLPQSPWSITNQYSGVRADSELTLRDSSSGVVQGGPWAGWLPHALRGHLGAASHAQSGHCVLRGTSYQE